MSRRKKIACIALLLLCAAGMRSGLRALAEAVDRDSGPLAGISISLRGQTATSATEDTDDVLINPGKGFVFMGYMDEKHYPQDFRDIVTIGYNRFTWSKVEPEEGEYDWDVIDNFIECYEEQGKQFAFGVMCANTSKDLMYTTPKWVFDAGAQGKRITTEDGCEQIIPCWTDPVFLEKLDQFTEALARRYDGDPRIAYVDIRSYGNWGEQHTYGLGDSWPDITAQELKELYIEPYLRRFTKTQLVSPYGGEEYEETYRWAIEQGVTIRRDGIISHSDGSEGRLVFGKLPAIFEYPGQYLRAARKNGDWQYDEVEAVVETGAPTYLQIYDDMYASNPAFYRALANRLGYYFRLKGAVYPSSAAAGQRCEISLTFRNDGVAPVYAPAALQIGLLDGHYRLVEAYPIPAAPETWMPGEDVTVNAALALQSAAGAPLEGEYILAAGLFADDADHQPDYKLGSTGGTGDNWYVFGVINIQGN